MRKNFRIMPVIYTLDTAKQFCEEFQVGGQDLILTNPRYYENYFQEYAGEAKVIYARDYGTGEPTDDMADRIYADIKNLDYRRVIGIGGGSILDVAKVLALKEVSPIVDLYDGRREIKKEKELILVPTTCGTGSEVTSVAVLNVLSKGTKMGLQTDEEFADAAVLIPELLEQLPFAVFATSSLDAFIHASESFLSPKATELSRMFSEKAIRMIIRGYRRIAAEGKEALKLELANFLLASTYAGIAFGNAGCGAVHAMSMPFSGAHHVAHGEANYAIFAGVFQAYKRLNPRGAITEYLDILTEELESKDADVSEALKNKSGDAPKHLKNIDVIEQLEQLFTVILKRKKLREYGVTEEEIPHLAELVIEKQKRLTANNYTELGKEAMEEIYRALW